MRDSNKPHHIFASWRHNLDRLVQQYGSREAAAQAIQDAVDAAFHAGGLIANTRGVFEATLDIGGNQATVRGVILQGMARIGSAWILVQQSRNADDET